MTEEFHAGMIAYEQLCEEMLMRSNLSKRKKETVQTQILDTAQAAFEQFFEGSNP